MNYKLIVLFVFFIPLELFSQKGLVNLGVTYGVGQSNIKKHSVLGNRYQYLTANSLSFKLDYFLVDKLSIESGIGIEQRGGEFIAFEREIIGDQPPLMLGDTIESSNKNKFAYFSIPLGLTFHQNITEKLRMNFLFGGYFNFMINQQWIFEMHDVFTTIENGTLQFNYTRKDIGIYGGLGLEYFITKQISMIAEYKIQKGMKDVFADEDIEGFHNRNYLDIGIKFRLGR